MMIFIPGFDKRYVKLVAENILNFVNQKYSDIAIGVQRKSSSENEAMEPEGGYLNRAV